MSSVIEQQRFTCAIGAMQTVVAIPRAVPILHSGPGCGTMVAGFFERATGYAGGSTAPCTNFSEAEVVFGGEEKLRKIINNTYKILDTDLQVILTGCTSDIVGDDVGNVAADFAEDGKPIVHLETAGFKSNNFVAHSQVVNAIIDQYTLKFADLHKEKNPKLVNLFASIPYQDPFWKGNLYELKRILEGIDLKVNIFFGPYSNGLDEWKSIPQASFNILVSPWYGKEIVDHLETVFQQPYYQFPYLPIGGNETNKFLEGVISFAQEHNANLDTELAKNFIQRENQAFYEEIDNLATFLLEFRYGLPNYVHIIHDAGYVVGISKFLLHEVGIVPKEQFVVDKVPQEFHEEIARLLKETSNKKEITVVFTPDAGFAQEQIRARNHHGRGLIIGSGWDKELAKEKDFDFLSAAAPSPYRLVLTTGYAGYTGGLRLIEDIYDVVLTTYA